MTRLAAIEEQAARLARWLEARPGVAPPEGVDPEVLEALWVLRPDLAPAPRVTVDEILAGVTSGPCAPEVVRLDSHRRAEAPAARVRPRKVAWWSGIGALAVAALALVVVRPYLPRGVPESTLEPEIAPSAAVAPAQDERPAAPAPDAEVQPVTPTLAEDSRPATRARTATPPPAAPVPVADAPLEAHPPIPEVMAPQAQAVYDLASPSEAIGAGSGKNEGVYGWGQDDAMPTAAEKSRAEFEAATRPDADDGAEALGPLLALLEDPDPGIAQDAALRAARLQLEAGLASAALATLERGLARDMRPTRLRAGLLALQGAVLEQLGRPAEAEEAYRAAEAIGSF